MAVLQPQFAKDRDPKNFYQWRKLKKHDIQTKGCMHCGLISPDNQFVNLQVVCIEHTKL